MKKVLLAMFVMLMVPQFSRAEGCDPLKPSETGDRVLRAALSLERLNGGGHALTTQVISYSSLKDTWAVIFSYSGIQNAWQVKMDERGCLVTSVSKFE